MQFYEAKPGMFLVVGVTLEEHQQAMTGNYEPGRDEYLEQRLAEVLKEEHRLVMEDTLRERDRSGLWKTNDGRELKHSEMTDEHINNSVRFLQRHEIGVEIVVPNLVREFVRRFGERP